MLTSKKLFPLLKGQLPYLRNTFGVKRIAVFGSFAEGDPNENSDIDLLVEFNKIPGLKFIALIEYLEEKLGKPVDILTPGGLKGIRISRVSQAIKKNLRYV